MLVSQPLENPPDRVQLLAVNLPVTVEDFVNDRQLRVQLRRVREDLLERLSVSLVFGTCGVLDEFSSQNAPPNFGPVLHLRKHLGLLRNRKSEISEKQRVRPKLRR